MPPFFSTKIGASITRKVLPLVNIGEHTNEIKKWMFLHSLLMISAGTFYLIFYKTYLLWGLPLLSFFYFYYLKFKKEANWKFAAQAANLVTLIRLAGLLMIAFFETKLTNFQMGIILIFILSADGLDGWLARRNKTVSEFGVYLDAETDAFFVLLASLFIFQFELLGGWILVAGFLRYAYFLAVWFLQSKTVKEHRFYFAKVAAVVLMISLISCFLLPKMIYQPACVVGLLMVLVSFGIEIFR